MYARLYLHVLVKLKIDVPGTYNWTIVKDHMLRSCRGAIAMVALQKKKPSNQFFFAWANLPYPGVTTDPIFFPPFLLTQDETLVIILTISESHMCPAFI